jgi:hypothetical protein
MEGAGALKTEERHFLAVLELYREVPIYLLSYPRPTVFDRATHKAEIEAITALPDPRFALVINCQNLQSTEDYRPREQVEVHQSPAFLLLQKRLWAVARYNPGSLTSFIQSMVLHVYARQGVSAGFAPDLDSARGAVKRAIDGRLQVPPP